MTLRLARMEQMNKIAEHYAETATWEGAPVVGDRPISLDHMPKRLGVDKNTPYTWSHRGALPQHDGVCGRSRWWWESKIVAWHEERNTVGGRPKAHEAHHLRRVA